MSPSNNKLALSLGATHIIDRNLPLSELAEAVKTVTTKPLLTIYDSVSSPETQSAAYDVLAPGGTLVVVLLETIKEKKSADKEAHVVYGSVHMEMHNDIGPELFKHLTGWFESGELKVMSLYAR